ncbi:glycerate kinase type-2 family protein [Kordiimonas marina]|uniref:glycerate kinase type-2 family protein n=1 Tax=Kordiimonas marina TaxID=2872312 RepID=UPI001FF1672C|nr:glycerate kinase [Kordiimonas marina]MCJ9430470.1 glycerate kinase [Kordiimonas marina]
MAPLDDHNARILLMELFDTAVCRVQAATCLPSHLRTLAPAGKTLVLGAGKAAAAMAATVADTVTGDISGLVVTRYGHGVPGLIHGIEVLEAAHPVPDDMSQQAARRMLALAGTLKAEDRLIFLASGGGSSVLSLPAPGFSFAEKQALMKHLLHSGATISEINCVRKHVSAIKGGRLAQAAGDAEVVTYVISDVPGDSLADVGSGPTIADGTTLKDASAIIAKYGAPEGSPVLEILADPANETVKHARAGWHTDLVASAGDALAAARNRAERQGLRVIDLGPDLEGMAADLGRAHARMALEAQASGLPTLILSGGETTVEVRNPDGCGGRNMEYALGLACALKGAEGIHALACDTDGIDGSEDAAGAYVSPSTLARADEMGLSAEDHLKENRSYAFFKALGDLVVTGPTRTNVNDFRAILVRPVQ